LIQGIEGGIIAAAIGVGCEKEGGVVESFFLEKDEDRG
jgi:hypothetical protein